MQSIFLDHCWIFWSTVGYFWTFLDYFRSNCSSVPVSFYSFGQGKLLKRLRLDSSPPQFLNGQNTDGQTSDIFK